MTETETQKDEPGGRAWRQTSKQFKKANSKRKKKPVVPLMDDNREIAFALVLWKAARSKFMKYNMLFPQKEAEAAANRAIELAKKCGVKDEFFEILFKLPLIQMTISLPDSGNQKL